MTDTQVAQQLAAGARCSAAVAARKVPPRPGYYAIFVDVGGSLPKPFDDYLRQRGTHLVYIGIATVSLLKRLVEQDLRHKDSSTFFRGIGAILGYRPPPGSLVGKKNQRNYRFSASDTAKVIKWIDEHISVNWVEAKLAMTETEAFAVGLHRPLINSTHNPERLAALAALRRECEDIAIGGPLTPCT